MLKLSVGLKSAALAPKTFALDASTTFGGLKP